MIAAIVGELGREDAEEVVRAAVPGAAVRAERKVYYPYYWLQLRYTVRTVLGRSAFRVACMVDSRTRLGASTDPFEIETVEPRGRDVVAPRVDESEARRIAERYTGYVLRNRRRAFVAPAVDVDSCRLVHKPFWIVTHEPIGHVLVDGLTGGFYPLRVVR